MRSVVMSIADAQALRRCRAVCAEPRTEGGSAHAQCCRILDRKSRARGLRAEAGFEMLVQQVPEYLRFFGFDDLAQTLQADLGPVRAMLYPK